MASATRKTEVGRGYIVGAIALSCGVAGLGVLSLWMAIRQDLPIPFGAMSGVTLIFVAVWNVVTLDRESEYPEGWWLTALAVLGLVTGLAAVLSSMWPVGIFLISGGVVGLIGRTRSD